MRYIFIFILTLSSPLYAQLQPDFPKIIGPSPQSKGLTIYGDYPMNSNMGLVDISIPLYRIKTKKIDLPITMSFHASGRMANEINGILGIRWSLNFGGLITRVVKGRPDEWANLSPYIIDHESEPTFESLYHSCVEGFQTTDFNASTKYDSEFDIFSYVLPNGKRGHFILKNQNGIRLPMMIPYSPLKIELTSEPSYYGYYKKITITDTDGMKYIFGDEALSSSEFVEFNGDSPHEGMLGSIPTGWYLKAMISADNVEQVNFSYTRREFNQPSFSETARVSDRIRDNSMGTTLNPYPDDPYGNYIIDFLYYTSILEDIELNDIKFNTPTISSIQFNGGVISFDYLQTNLSVNKWLLSEINISGDYQEKIKFSAFLHPYEKDIYYLKNVKFLGENLIESDEDEIYEFNYYEPNNNDEIQPRNLEAAYKDWWGFYKRYGIFESTRHSLPSQQIEVLRSEFGNNTVATKSIGYNVDREPDEQGKIIGMLKSIKYPTGGESEFIYESNRYDYFGHYNPPFNNSTLEGPGLRIKEVISKPTIGANKRKQFKYGSYENGRGFINEYLRPESANYEKNKEGTVMQYWDWSNEFGERKEQVGYRTREYLSEGYLSFDFSGGPVTYDVVTEYEGEMNNSIHKTVSEYNIKYDWVKTFNLTDYNEGLSFNRKFYDPENAENAHLLSKSYYQNVNGSFELVKREEYGYQSVDKDYAWDMPVYRHGSFYVFNTIRTSEAQRREIKYNKEKDYHENICNVYGYGFRKYVSRCEILNNIITKEYYNSNTLETSKTYTFDPVNLMKRTEEFTNSEGVIEKKVFTYPFDNNNIAVYGQMSAKHIIEPVIQTDYYVDGNFLSSEKINYLEWFPNGFLPVNIETKQKSNSYESRIRYYSYDDHGNVLSVSKEGGPKTSYVWGYNGQYPIAEASNASWDEIYYDGFEDRTSGVSGGARTGEKCLAYPYPYGNIITKIMPVGKEYVISYWTKAPNCPWTYSGELPYLNNTHAMTGGPYFDDLRICPSDAQMTTYTYKPLVGMTSMTDPKNLTTHYEYDGFQRLKSMEDAEGNILKNYEYHYKDQP